MPGYWRVSPWRVCHALAGNIKKTTVKCSWRALSLTGIFAGGSKSRFGGRRPIVGIHWDKRFLTGIATQVWVLNEACLA